jgi:hypothetical protein
MRRVLACLAFCGLASGAPAQSGEWVVVESRALLAGGRTAEDTKREALYGALAEAVRRVAGVAVHGSAQVVRSDSAGRAVDRYVEAVRLDAAGRALEWHVLREGWRTVTDRVIGSQVYYEMQLRVRVERERGMPDASFSVRLTTNADQFVVRDTALAANDEIILTVTSTLPAALTIVNIVDDSVFVLAPNALMPDLSGAPGIPREVPDAAARRMGLRFRVSLPDGVARRTELLAVVATRRPVPLRSRMGSGATRDTGAMTLAAFNAWLVDIPLGERAVAQVPVEIRRAR